jgi:V/A-type H+/Na+-transporting ATPase subunit I
MIIKMKKVAVVCLKSNRNNTLDKMAELGVLHVEAEKLADSHDRVELEQLNTNAGRIAAMLDGINAKEVEAESDVDGEAVFKKAAALFDERDKIAKRLEQLAREMEQLRPWGNFNPKDIHKMRAKGVFVYLCSATKQVYEEFVTREDILLEIIEESKAAVCFVVVSQSQLNEEDLPLAPMSMNISLSEVEDNISKDMERDAEAVEKLAKLKASAPALVKYLEQLDADLELTTVRDGMSDHGELICLTGYVPVPDVEKLEEYAETHGWGLLLEDPDPFKDRIPTLIKLPKIFRLISPMFEFLGISPGYDEFDVSVCFLFFFTIFFGMIVGDAGYGSLFLVATIIAKIFIKNPKAKLPIRLFATLSIATIAWGAWQGNWFGTAPAPTNEQNALIQLICFTLALAHLCIGRLWRAIAYGISRAALGEIGWALILWGNFFLIRSMLVYPGPYPKVILFSLYGSGLLLIVVCGINWKDIADIFNFPFGLIGSFIDMLSYIRLFAVGLAGYYIASSFNDMAMSLTQASIWLIPVTIIIILFGHLLNIALCMMGVLVHGVRLNVLEFSNHIGLRWAGFEYKPFKKLNNKD